MTTGVSAPRPRTTLQLPLLVTLVVAYLPTLWRPTGRYRTLAAWGYLVVAVVVLLPEHVLRGRTADLRRAHGRARCHRYAHAGRHADAERKDLPDRLPHSRYARVRLTLIAGAAVIVCSTTQ